MEETIGAKTTDSVETDGITTITITILEGVTEGTTTEEVIEVVMNSIGRVTLAEVVLVIGKEMRESGENRGNLNDFVKGTEITQKKS